MPLPSDQAGTDLKEGIAALQSGNARLASQRFEQIVARGDADASVWVALAMARQMLKDETAMMEAVEQALALEPANLRALLMKGDYLAAHGKVRSARSFYNAAVTLAAQMQNLPASIAQAVSRANDMRRRIEADIERHLLHELAARGYQPGSSSGRFTQSVDLLTGKKQRFVQEPRAFFFPELPNVQFYPRESFAWLERIEAATEEMCAELRGVLQTEAAFVPYIRKLPDSPVGEHPLLESREWSAFFLWKDGKPIPENAERCPRTMAALKDVPLARIKGRTPSVLFSRLSPGARIPPHTGYLNTRLICHLPLIVPAGCHFRVGNDQRVWEKGKAWVFDDTIEHEAWNSSGESRVVLIFDVWRPELSSEERDLVAALMEAVDSYDSSGAEIWSA